MKKCYHIDDERGTYDYFVCVDGDRMFVSGLEFEKIVERFPHYGDSGMLTFEEVEKLAMEGRELSVVAVIRGVEDWDVVRGECYPAFSSATYLVVGRRAVVLVADSVVYVAES